MNFEIETIYRFFDNYYNYIIVYLLGCPVAMATAIEKWGKPNSRKLDRCIGYFTAAVLSWALVLVLKDAWRSKR